MSRPRRDRPKCPFCQLSLERRRAGSRNAAGWQHPQPSACPSLERAQHGEIERVAGIIIGDDGGSASPLRAKTSLATLHSRGVIDHGMLVAGEVFGARFRHAHLDTLRAFDLTQPTRSAHYAAEVAWPARIEGHRDYVWSRIVALGGLAALPGSCAWAVLGLERSIAEWCAERALHGRRVDAHEGRGILVAALAVLAVDPVSRTWRPPPPARMPPQMLGAAGLRV